jgi:hypothetical protein
MSQDGKTIELSSTGDYFHKLSTDVAKGMTFIVSTWAGNMSWLSKDKCWGTQCSLPELNFTNIKVRTGSGSPSPPPPPPPYNPSDFTFGDVCAGIYQDCGSQGCSVDHCKFSWPRDDPLQWSSPDARCRCDVN